MAIIIRESKTINGKIYDNLKVYKSETFPITLIDEQNAELLDDYINNEISNIVKFVKKNGLYALKGKNGVIKLWYKVGERLSFIDNPEILKPSDRKYIWQAIWFHASDLIPGEAKTRAGTSRDHFLYCYKLAKYEEEFVLNAGTWHDWSDLFDSPVSNNIHFLKWFEEKSKLIKEKKINNWLRLFLKKLRSEFQNKDMSFLNSEYIYNKCDKIMESL